MIFSTAEKFEQPIIQKVGEKRHWIFWKRPTYRLVEDYSFEYGPKDARSLIWAKAGFEFDLKSNPPGSEIAGIENNGDSDGATVFHDYFCRTGCKFIEGYFEYYTKVKDQWIKDLSPWYWAEVHDLYKYMCRLGGMGKLQSYIEYIGVSLWNR